MKYCLNDDCVHFHNTGSRGEFRDDIEACSDCGTSLSDTPVPSSPEPAEAALEPLGDDGPPMPEDEKLVVIQQFTSAGSAQAAVIAIREAGIPAGLVSGDSSGFYPNLTNDRHTVFVPESLVDDAKSVLFADLPTEPADPLKMPPEDGVLAVVGTYGLLLEADAQWDSIVLHEAGLGSGLIELPDERFALVVAEADAPLAQELIQKKGFESNERPTDDSELLAKLERYIVTIMGEFDLERTRGYGLPAGADTEATSEADSDSDS